MKTGTESSAATQAYVLWAIQRLSEKAEEDGLLSGADAATKRAALLALDAVRVMSGDLLLLPESARELLQRAVTELDNTNGDDEA